MMGSATPAPGGLTSNGGGLDLTRSRDLLALARHVAPELVLRAVRHLALVAPAPAAVRLPAARLVA